EYIMNSHSLMLTLDITPPATPASSPDDFMYLAPFAIGIWPSAVTVVGPWEVSDACPMFGYGIGIGLGAGGAGVLHTSGKTVLNPPLPLCTSPRKFTKVVCPMISP